MEIDDRKRLLRPGDHVLDLGCAPGSWLQVSAERVGLSGIVVGLDLKPSAQGLGPNVLALRGDVWQIDAADLVRAAARAGGHERLFDVVLSDMAPNTSGHGDDFISARLCRRVLELAPALLRPGGHLVMKIFEGAEYSRVLREASDLFAEARGFKPRASRDVSREMYIVCKGLRPRPERGP
jgi:23S rRNA (uridine2552-2'-O)-methyltransferase